jgi:uncharacterized protein
MLVNVPERIYSRFSGQRGLPPDRPVYIEEFRDGSGFVFNAQHPSGVKYLTKDAFISYAELIKETGCAPCVDPGKSPLHADLVKHGIAGSTGGAPARDKRAVGKKQFSVWFHISNACNLSCSYCYVPTLEKAVDVQAMATHFMSASTIRAATRGLFEFCAENNFRHLQIKFAGGEPTLNVEGINATCDIARTLASECNITVTFAILTNGVFIDERIFPLFKKFHFAVSISMDGDRERHDESRFTILRSRPEGGCESVKRAGSWKIIDQNISTLLLQGIRPFILCTVTERNYRHLLDLAKYTVSKRIGFRLSLVRDRRSHENHNFGNELLSELIRVYEWLGENMPADMPIERYARFAEWRPESKKESVCGTCNNSMAIDQEGKVASCQMRMDKPHGTVHEEGLSSIFHRLRAAEENRYLTSPQTKSGDCSICYWKFTCAGGCPEHTRMVMGTANSPSPWCHVYQEFLPHYLRAIARQIKARVDRS